MTITIVANGDSCNIVEKDSGGETRNIFALPMPRAAVIDVLRILLTDPESRDVTSGDILVERMRDGVRVHVSRANYSLPWGSLFPILEA